MQVSVISFTKNGLELSKKIEKAFGDWQIKLYTKYKIEGLENSSSISYVSQGISEWAGEQMGQKNALVFIGACGIAVRAIASYVKDKLQDSPVLVMDEQGNYVIPLLSGHIGGANDIANILAERLQATPVITTATDVNRRFAVDLFAQKNGLKIVNKDGIAKISSKILDGKTITVAIEEGHWDGVGIVPEQIELVDLDSEIEKDIVIKTENEMDKAELILQPKEYIIGIGCKRGKEEDKLIRWIQKSLEEAGIFMEQVYALASIDRKKEEEGLLRISQRERIPFYTYSAEELERVTGNLHESEFVKKTVGVSNVCERAALYACGDGGRLVYEKHAEDGMTIAKTAKELEKETDLQLVPVTKEKPLIAVARDEAFCFYYAENLSMLEQLGAELVFFSPLHDCELPKDCHGLLLGGGYPELVAEALSRNQSMLVSIRQAIEKGMPSVAECGGFMYLHGSITDEVGMKMPMAGVIPATCYNNGKLVRFGYIELEDKQGYFMTKGNKIRAHEFHYYDSTNNGEACMATKPVTGKQYPCIMAGKKFWWGFPHLYYPSNPTFARHFVEEVVAYKKKTEKR